MQILDETERSGQRLTLEQHNLRLLNNHVLNKKYECKVCFSDYDISSILVLGCGHFLCKTCSKYHFTTLITEGKAQVLKCAQPDCKRSPLVKEIEYVVDRNVFEKYTRFLLDAHLAADPDCRWCPKKGCSTPMIGNKANPMMECPKCRFRFCFNCKTDEWHQGATCEKFQQWKRDNDQAGAKFEEWAKLHTKACPKCGKKIEKNGGCDHMTCGSCRYEFYWTTLKKYP